MVDRSQNNLNSTTIESKTLQPIVNVGIHTLSFIDKSIVEKLKIKEGDFCEQYITNKGNILLKIRRI
jgi:hypothetical protein